MPSDGRLADSGTTRLDPGPTKPIEPVAAKPGAPFDPDILHSIRITMLPADEAKLRKTAGTITCDVEVDGTKLPQSLCHRKGSFGSISPIKPAVTIKFDGTIPNQKLDGLDHLVLNNAKQDPSFLNEHMAYEFARRAGLPAPLTSHGRVEINGKPQGLYVLKEAIVKDFLARNFGKTNKNGNLYKAPIAVDFVKSPERMELKNEKEEMRSRQDLMTAVAVIRTATDANFEAEVNKVFNIPEVLTTMATDVIVGHLDGPFVRANNYYLYDDPRDNRFVMIPHGMDWLFGGSYPVVKELRLDRDPFAPFSTLSTIPVTVGIASRIRKIPTLEAKFRAEVSRVIREAWDEDAMNARIDRVARVVQTAQDVTGPLADDLQNFNAMLGKWRSLVSVRKAFVLGKTP